MELGLIAGSGLASGLNVYAVVVVLGLLGRLGVGDIPDELTSVPALIGAGVLYLVEFFADKVPYLDNVWDAIHTVVRPVAAGWIGYLLAGELGLSAGLGAGTSAGAALVAHSAKATTRAAVNISPEPFSNAFLSVFEDVSAAGVVALAVASPAVALVVTALLVIGGVALVVWLWKAIFRVWRRIRSHGIAT